MANLDVKLTKKQWELLQYFNDPQYTEILFGGGGRGGKTWGICEIIFMTCIAYPGIAWGVGRKEWDDLRKSTLVTLLKVMDAHGAKKWLHYDINMQTKELHFYNYSRVFFIPLKLQPTDPEFNFLGWYELTHSFVDEAQEINRKAIDVLKTRLTEKIKEYNLTGKMLMGCNPMKWHLYTDFIKATKEGYIEPNRVFIQSLYKDNPHIDHKKYEENYQNADKVTKERLLNGNWEYDDTPWKLYDYDAICDLFTNPTVSGEKYIVWDVAWQWADRAWITVWDGFDIIDSKVFDKCTPLELQACVKGYSQKYSIPMSRTLLDEDGIGWWVVGNLQCKWFQNNSSPIDNRTDAEKRASGEWGGKPLYQNLKTQCYFTLQDYIEKISLSKVPEKYHELIKQELDVQAEIELDKDGPRKIMPKEKIKELIGRSPDFGDTIAMRMYFQLLKPKKDFVLIGL